jgi:hypothetical protein
VRETFVMGIPIEVYFEKLNMKCDMRITGLGRRPCRHP